MKKYTIKEIEETLATIEDKQHPLIMQWLTDERKGVQLLINRWQKQQIDKEAQHASFLAKTKYEQEAKDRGCIYIAGVDEVGRGPLAGPVIAAAVILPDDFFLPGLDDSKKLSETKREQYYDITMKDAVAVGLGIVSAEIIDDINIYQAAKKAMKEAVCALAVQPDYLLVDAMEIPLPIKQTSIIKGDANSISIAAASVVAKVTRDRMMKELARKYPQYGFESHMGYGTAQHLEAIRQNGVMEEHRRSFAPIQNAIS